MIVVSIIGIMASMAIPSFLRFQCRAKQSEAKAMLKSIYVVQETYSGEWGNYVDLTGLTTYGGLDPLTVTSTRFYGLALTNTTSTFVATAVDSKNIVLSAGVVDQWEIDHADPRPILVVDRCSVPL